MSSLSSTALKCVAVLKTGLNKGTICKNHAKHGIFCGVHKKNIQEAIPTLVQENNRKTSY